MIPFYEYHVNISANNLTGQSKNLDFLTEIAAWVELYIRNINIYIYISVDQPQDVNLAMKEVWIG